jgi:predicted amidophosphoribosyltransferase
LYRGAGRNLILAFKHGDRTDIAIPAGQWLYQAVHPHLSGVDVIAPVPLHRLRFLRRRYNQASLLAKNVASLSGIPFCADLLVRPRGLGGLEGLGAVERAEKMRGAIEPNRRRAHLISGSKVLLVDDVLTSGATLRAATQACLTANAKEVCVATLARVAKDA